MKINRARAHCSKLSTTILPIRSETDPDYKGSYKHADGTEDGLNVWINTSKNGDKYMKISGWSRAETAAKGVQQAKQALAPKPEPQPQGFPEDDIPF